MKIRRLAVIMLIGDLFLMRLLFMGKAEPVSPVSGTAVVQKKVALTYDDGPSEKYTPLLLDGLKERGIPATFFLLGKSAEQYPELVKREYDEGHLLGNHTYSHI